jgi:hypothetical protein
MVSVNGTGIPLVARTLILTAPAAGAEIRTGLRPDVRASR